MQNAWTEEQISYLVLNYPLESTSEIAIKLNKNVKTIQSKANSLGIKKCIKSTFINLKHKISGNLTAIEPILDKRSANGSLYWKCICKCGKEHILDSQSFQKTTKHKCVCSPQLRPTLWKGCGELSGSYWKCIKYAAKRRKIVFDLDIRESWNLFIEQNRQCYFTGINLRFVRIYRDYEVEYQTASLDRIDPNLPYTLNNVVWTHKIINCMRLDFTITEFLAWCNKVVNPKFSQRSITIQKNRFHTWNGYGNISGGYWSGIKYRARQKKFELLDISQAWELYERQNGLCALTGIPIDFSPDYCRNHSAQTASLDRINSTKGYTLNNVQWVHKNINRMKWDLCDQEFVAWCKLVLDNYPNQISNSDNRQ